MRIEALLQRPTLAICSQSLTTISSTISSFPVRQATATFSRALIQRRKRLKGQRRGRRQGLAARRCTAQQRRRQRQQLHRRQRLGHPCRSIPNATL